jgi:hypothetical protein
VFRTDVSCVLCAGEIGPVGSTTYLHGFTCAVGILRDTGTARGEPGTDASADPLQSRAPQEPRDQIKEQKKLDALKEEVSKLQDELEARPED